MSASTTRSGSEPPMNLPAVSFYDQHPGQSSLRDEVMVGLARTPKAIPPKFFYDQRGSRLFDEICELPEYYLTRTETGILQSCAGEIAASIDSQCMLVELGSGAGKKVRLLLSALRPAHYMGVDISRDFLLESSRSLARDYPWLEVHATCADFSSSLTLPESLPPVRKMAFFPGSSIGNFDPVQAGRFLKQIARMVGGGGYLLIGVDLKKDVDRLNAAYNDGRGLTAAFNFNLLWRIRDELDSRIDLDAFEHLAFYNEAAGRVEMHLRSTRDQVLGIEDRDFHIAKDETIHTEDSYKYTIEEFAALGRGAGFNSDRVWTDPERLFSVHLMCVA